jgi:hypothetical protein
MEKKRIDIKSIFQKQIAFPSDHGSWVFLLSPFIIGLCAAEKWSSDIVFLLLGLLAAFFLRQPISIAVKAISNRRSRQVLPAAIAWTIIYTLIGVSAFINLALRGYSHLFWLAIPGLLVFSWHLWLVSQRLERYQIAVDIIASGTLALAAPAAYWVSLGNHSSTGWALWALAWLQSAASIVYAFLRLYQRRLKEFPSRSTQLKMGYRALSYSGFNLIVSSALSATSWLPDLIWIPFLVQFSETLWGVFNPAIGEKPSRIGLRQLVVSTMFTLAFVLAWNW